MLIDTTPIHRSGQYEVIQQCYEITLPDGTITPMHPVLIDGIEHTFLRAFNLRDDMQVNGDTFAIADVRKMCRTLAEEMLTTAARDMHGLILYTLRATFKRRADLFAACRCLAAEMLTPEINELRGVPA